MSSADELAHFLEAHPGTWVLTGAGISLASGIPTYRDKNGDWQRSDPIKHQEFLRLESKRQRYWARSMVGWKAVQAARPNGAHESLSKLQRAGVLGQIVTQNVDGLHQKADSDKVIDLHGRLDAVICMDCGQTSKRADLQPRLETLNPDLAEFAARSLPDGDADIDDFPMNAVQVPPCECCGGMLKPDVVFFGDNVPRDRVQRAMDSLRAAPAALVVGSSLRVLSGYRFCLAASEQNLPLASLNPGVTRADELLTHRWGDDCVTTLLDVQAKLT